MTNSTLRSEGHMRLLVLLLTVFLSQSLAAEETPQDDKQGGEQEVVANVYDDAVPSLVNLSFLPSAIVNGCVNVISGDLCENETDDIVSGVDPYILGHNYCSSSLDEANLGDGWSFMHHQVLEVYMPCRIHLLSSRSIDSSSAVPWLFSLKAFEAMRPPSFSSSSGETDVDYAPDSSESPSSFSTVLFAGPLQARGIEERRRDDHPPRLRGPSYPDQLPIFLSLYEPSGARLLFKARADQKYDDIYKLRSFNLVTKNSGYTNVSGGSISAHTNVKNTVVTYDSKDDAFTVVLGDGTRRIYERAKGYKPVHKKPHQASYYRRYLLHKESKPSGNRMIYEYNSSSEIIRISTYNSDYSHKINEVLFDQKSTGAFAKHPSLHVRTSDGFEHIYRCTKLKGHFPHGTYGISRIQSPGRPETGFTYCEKSAQHKRRVVRKTRSDGFYIDTKYYRHGTNKVGDAVVEVKGHFRKNRVRWQSAPLGPRGQRVTTHRYFYHKDKHGGGYTTVYDAYKNPTHYYYNKDKRLTRIVRLNGYREKLMSERFHWGSEGEEGFLKSHVIYDEEDKPKLARYFNYDSRGNVVKETLYGRITENDGSLRIQKGAPHHESCDKQVKRFTYSKDEFNLKTSERDSLGNYTLYTYVKGTNLLKAKYVCEKTEIKKREFFAYDKNANLIKHIVDDGRSQDEDSLKHVTQRYITNITPRTERPHFGAPEVVQEYYYDLDKEKKVLLKKTVNHFSKQGLVSKKEVFDQESATVCHEYAYDFAGRLIWSKDPHGHERSISYDKWGRLVEKRGPRQDVRCTYEYDVAGRLIREAEEHTNGLTLATCYEYDLLGRKTAVTTPQGNTTRYEYDALNRIIKVVYPPIFDHDNKKIEPEKKFEHKKLGIKVVETDENQNVTCTMYNALGKITHQHFADDTEQFYEYDLKGNLVKEVASNGAVVSYTRDIFDRVIQSHMQKDNTVLSRQEVVYSAFHPVKEIGPTGQTVEYSYDFAGRKVREKRSGPFKSERMKTFAYDARGRFVETRTLLDQNAFVGQSYTYNDLDQVISEKVHSHKELCSYKGYSYDAEGNRTAIVQNIDGKEAIFQVHYHPHGLAEWSQDAMGNKTLYKYFYYFVNEHGQRVFRKDTTDARGCTVEERFDVRGNVSEVLRFDPFGTVIAHTKQFYDPANNLVRIHESAIVDGREQRVIITLFEYGKNNRVARVIEAAGTAEEKSTSYAYNRYGQKESTTYSDGTILYYAYDAKGRLERFFAHDSSFDYTYSYDSADRILAVTNGMTGAKTTRCYNDFGELASETLESGLTLTYAYDTAGRVSEMGMPDHSLVCYSYSPVYLQQIHRVDRCGNKRCVHAIVKRDLAGNVQATDSTAFSYDMLGRRTKIEHEAFSQQVPAGGFDPVGNLLQLHTKDPQGDTTREFAYDFLSQLMKEKDGSTNTYTHDSLNNRLTHNEDRYSNNALHAVLGDGKRTFTYDGRGNRIAMQDRDTTVHYTYDAMDRLIGVEGPDVHVRYSYDAFNRRIQKQTDTTTVQYLYSLDNEIGAVVDGAVCELRLLGEGFGAEIGASIYMEIDGASYTPIHDRQGSVAVLLDETGQVAESYRHDAFGKEIAFTRKNCKNPWRFSSKRVDEETGFVYFGRRFYDPSIGKWLTQDPLGVKAGPNLYAYVLNNPMTQFDLYGLYVETEADRPVSKWCPYKCTDPKLIRANHNAITQMYDKSGYRTTSGSFFGKNDKGYAAVPLQNRPELSGGTIVYVPGMMTSFPRAIEQAMYISDLCGGYQVNVIHNFTHGILDIPRAIAETLGLNTDACQDLRDFLEEMVDSKEEGHKFFILGFSEGAIIAGNVLKGASERIFNATHALGVCPGSAIEKDATIKSKNIANQNPFRDFVPYLKSLGGLLFTGFKRADVESVPSHPDAPFFDHDVTSPTYAERIGDHFNDFREEIGGQ